MCVWEGGGGRKNAKNAKKLGLIGFVVKGMTTAGLDYYLVSSKGD